MALTDAQAADVYNVIEDAIVTILKAEATIIADDVLGISTKERGQPSIEAKLRNSPRDFADSELPSLTVMCVGGTDADAEGAGELRLIERSMNMQIFVLSRGGNLKEVQDRCQKVAAITEAFLRRQIHNGSELSTELNEPGNVADVIAKNFSTTFNPTGGGQNIFEVVGTMTFSVEVDICVNIP